MIFALLAQGFLVCLAYGAALLAAGAFASIAVTNIVTTFNGDPYALIDFTVLAMELAFKALVESFVPIVFAVMLTEALRIRGLALYLVIGCILGPLSVLPIDAIVSGATVPIGDGVLRLSVACGAVGAFFYWLIAGRTAGRWMEIGGLVEER